MTQEDILKKIEEIYASKNKEGKPSGKNFITHLIRSYTPINKIQKIWDSPNKNLKCCITGYGLCTIEDAFQALHSEGMDKKMIEHMKAWGRGEVAENPMRAELKGRILAYTGDKTDTAMCEEAVGAFISWIQNKILHGDNHVNWVIKDMQKKQIVQSIREKLPDQEDQKKIDRIEQISKHPKRATMSLGDMAILGELQAKLKAQEEDGAKK